jgi:hypothetical protein
MVAALRQQVTVQPGGVIEVRSPELPPGARAEVIVLLERSTPDPPATSGGSAGNRQDADAWERLSRFAGALPWVSNAIPRPAGWRCAPSGASLSPPPSSRLPDRETHLRRGHETSPEGQFQPPDLKRMRARRDDDPDAGGIVGHLLHLSLRWPPAGLIGAAGFAAAGYVARHAIRSEFGGSFAGEMVSVPLYLIGGFCFVFFLVGSVLWLVRRATAAASPRAESPPPVARGVVSGAAPAPVCPACSVQMVRRVARIGRRAGRPFWGCRNFPRCRQTFDIT